MSSLLVLVGLLLTLAQLTLVARMVVDWVLVLATPVDPPSPIHRAAGLLRRVTEPALAPLRRVLPPVRVGPVSLDLSLIAAVLFLAVLRAVLGV